MSEAAVTDLYEVSMVHSYLREGVTAPATFCRRRPLYLDSAYKLVAYDGRPVRTLSSAKATAPGIKQVFRRPGYADVIALREEAAPGGAQPLSVVVMAGPRRTSRARGVARAREVFTADLADLPPAARRVHRPQAPTAAVSPRLVKPAADVRRRLHHANRSPTGSFDPWQPAAAVMNPAPPRARRQPCSPPNEPSVT